jgi:hypothetical protein
MSGPLTRSKKQRVEQTSAPKPDINTFCFAPSKTLPRVLERLVLSFLSPRECSQLVTLSKDVYELVKSFFEQMRSCCIDEVGRPRLGVLSAAPAPLPPAPRHWSSLCV